MTRKYTESEIRDIIADNLQCIEPKSSKSGFALRSCLIMRGKQSMKFLNI